MLHITPVGFLLRLPCGNRSLALDCGTLHQASMSLPGPNKWCTVGYSTAALVVLVPFPSFLSELLLIVTYLFTPPLPAAITGISPFPDPAPPATLLHVTPGVPTVEDVSRQSSHLSTSISLLFIILVQFS